MTGVLQREAIVAEARRWLGTPYRHQASVAGVAADCLGLVRGVWRGVIGPEPAVTPPYTRDWAEAGGAETLAAAAFAHLHAVPLPARQAGDVVLFRFRPDLPAKHAGILVDADRMIHAYERVGVVEIDINGWWRRRIAYVFAFPGGES